MEGPLVSLISRIIWDKASMPREIIRVEMGAPPILVKGLARSVFFIHSFQKLLRHLEFYSQLSREGDISYLCAQMTSWFDLYGFSIPSLTPTHLEICSHQLGSH